MIRLIHVRLADRRCNDRRWRRNAGRVIQVVLVAVVFVGARLISARPVPAFVEGAPFHVVVEARTTVRRIGAAKIQVACLAFHVSLHPARFFPVLKAHLP